jgi:uncharacterized cupin superfamily protein
VNRSNATAVCLEVGSRSAEDVTLYSDIDMKIDKRGGGFTRKDGTPY